MEILKYILVLFLFSSCGSQLADKIGRVEAPVLKTDIFGLKVSGQVMDVNDQVVQLSEVTVKPRIIIFAATFCGICQAEHRNLRDIFALNNNQRPTNVDVITIMTDSLDNLDALDFKSFTAIQWDPYYQIGDELRNTLCGKGSANPCVIVERPNEGVVFQHVGEVSIHELQSLTGAWLW